MAPDWPLLTVADSFQSLGFIAGPLLGGAFSARHVERLMVGLGFLSLLLAERVGGVLGGVSQPQPARART